MRRRTTFALVAGGTLAAVAWSRSERGVPGLPKPATGMFPNGMAYLRWGTGPKTLLWIVGGPGLGFPIGLRVALIPLVLRPFAQAGYTCWLVNRKRDMPEGYTIADMAEDHAALIADELGGKVDLVLGEDYGGWIGFYLAARHPERLDFLANATTGYALTERGRAIDRDFAALVRDGRPTDAWAQMLSTLAPGLRPPALVRVFAAVLDRLFTDRSRPDFVSNLVVETEAEACDAREILPDIRVPVLLIGGDQGPFLSREILEETARLIPDCTLQLHEGKSDTGAVSSMQLPRDVLAWVEERSWVRQSAEPPRPAPIAEEAVSVAPATVPEASLVGATRADDRAARASAAP
jgi:pimeloyl-ACP methyl ester carboxylesterase